MHLSGWSCRIGEAISQLSSDPAAQIMRFFLTAALLLFFATTSFAKQPNILFIFADDQCFDTLREWGNDEIETPNLDRLARSGVTFQRAYNMGSWSGAVCVASRTMLNTGRFLWRAHEVHPHLENERSEGRFWSEHMRGAGYETYFSGKWHVGKEKIAQAAFDNVRHVRPGMPNQTPAGYNRPVEGEPDKWSPYDTKFDGFWKGGKHWSEVLGDDAVDYLEHAAGQDKPFFMYLAFNAPHDPRQSPKEFVDKYPLQNIAMPANFLPEYPFKDYIGAGPNLRDEKLAPFPRTEYAVKVNRQEYYAIITHMDQQIGRILDALEKTGKKEDTYIFYSADHGLAVGQHGLLGKQNMYDHSVRVPFIVSGPGVEPGRRVQTPVYIQDITASSLDLAGVEKPEHVEFTSVMPVARGETDKHVYDAIYGAYLQLQRSVTMDGYKLIVYPKAVRTRLYNLEKDPLERKDLANDIEHKKTKQKLFRRLLELQEQMGDELDLKSVFASL